MGKRGVKMHKDEDQEGASGSKGSSSVDRQVPVQKYLIHGSSMRGQITRALLACGRCNKTNATVPFPHVLDEAQGCIVVFPCACLRCFSPFSSSWSASYEWPDICSSCATDGDFNTKYEETCEVEEGMRASMYKHHEVVKRQEEQSYSVLHNYTLIPASDFAEAVGVSAMTPRLAEVAQSVVPDGSAGGLSGTIVKQIGGPFIDIQTSFNVRITRETVLMDPNNCLRQGQAEASHSLAAKDLKKSIPTALRGHIKPWDLHALRLHCAARARCLALPADREQQEDCAIGGGRSALAIGDEPAIEGAGDLELAIVPVAEAGLVQDRTYSIVKRINLIRF